MSAAPQNRPPARGSEALHALCADLLSLLGHFERHATRRVASGGLGKKLRTRLSGALRNPDEAYTAYLANFAIDRRILIARRGTWEVSRSNLRRLWQPDRLFRSLTDFWLRSPYWNESLADPDVLSFVRRNYVTQDPSLETRRRRLAEELRSAEDPIDIATLAAPLERSFLARGAGVDEAPANGRLPPGAALARQLEGPLAWMGFVAADAPTSGGERTLYSLTSIGRAAFASEWESAAAQLGSAMVDEDARATLQPSLEVLVPPQLDPDLYLAFARIADLRRADVYATYSLDRESLMHGFDAGASLDEIRDLFARLSATPIPDTLERLLNDCAERHGELQMGPAGNFLEARRAALLDEVAANPKFEPSLRKRIGKKFALLAADTDLDRFRKELQRNGYSVAAERETQARRGPQGISLTLSDEELAELYAAVRAALHLAREHAPDFDLSELSTLDDLLAMQVAAADDDELPKRRAHELVAVIDSLGATSTSTAPKAAPSELRDIEEIREFLAEAAASNSPVEIEYDGFQGVTTRRVVPKSFDGRYLTGHCELRDDERTFNSSKILALRPS